MADSRIVVTPSIVSASTRGQMVYDYLCTTATALHTAPVKQGEVVFLDPSNYWSAVVAVIPAVLSTAYGTRQGQTRGIAMNSAYPGQPLTVCIADPYFDCGGDVIKGKTYVAYNDAGFIQYSTSSTAARVVVGVASDTSRLALNLEATGAST